MRRWLPSICVFLIAPDVSALADAAPADPSTPASPDAPPTLPQAVEQRAAPAQQDDDEAAVEMNPGLRWRTALATGSAVALLSPMPLAACLVPLAFEPALRLPSPLGWAATGGQFACQAACCGAPLCIPAVPALVAWLHDQRIEWQPIAVAALGGLLTMTTAIGATAAATFALAGSGLAQGGSRDAQPLIVGALFSVPVIWAVGSIATGYAAWATFPGFDESGDWSVDAGSGGRPSVPTQWSRARAHVHVPLVARSPGSMPY